MPGGQADPDTLFSLMLWREEEWGHTENLGSPGAGGIWEGGWYMGGGGIWEGGWRSQTKAIWVSSEDP